MTKQKYIVSLVTGDWSGDGHSKHDTCNISSNIDNKAMEEAYQKATKILGFDFCNDIAADYEDSLISKERLDILIKNGLEIKKLDLEYDLKRKDFKEDEEIYIWIDDFIEIYLFIVKLGNPEFKYKVLEGDKNPTIHIGGYGLYE